MCTRAIRLMGDVLSDRQIMGFKSTLEAFRGAVTDVLPELAVFAKHGPHNLSNFRLGFDTYSAILLASDGGIISHLISTGSENDTEASAQVLNILSITAKQGVGPVMQISVATNALSHLDRRIRVAGLRVLENLADDKKYKNINFPAKDMLVRCFSDEVEAVKLAGLRTLFKFIDQEIFGDRVAILDTFPEPIFSLLAFVSVLYSMVTAILHVSFPSETFRRTIEATKLSEKYASAAKEGGWPLRVAFLKLMSVLNVSANTLRRVLRLPDWCQMTPCRFFENYPETNDSRLKTTKFGWLEFNSFLYQSLKVRCYGHTIPTDALSQKYLVTS
ncbi:hypothetical protein C8R45DRAFT_945146 [Mycena sanguinolenta]|nr:hypothetical protein C8R45DRAFT_945146 [Mycena sanguinolenta]